MADPQTSQSACQRCGNSRVRVLFYPLAGWLCGLCRFGGL
jgi:hypothetical protein